MVEMPNPEERLRQYPFELSGGLRQRVMIAMALVCEPKLLIADEPTTALDVTIQAQILDIFDDLREQLGMATMLITHDMGVIAGRTDRVVVMYAGRKAEEAHDRADLRRTCTTPTPRRCSSSVPRIDTATTDAAAVDPRAAAGPLQGDRGLPVRAAVPLRDRRVPRRRSPPLTGDERPRLRLLPPRRRAAAVERPAFASAEAAERSSRAPQLLSGRPTS